MIHNLHKITLKTFFITFTLLFSLIGKSQDFIWVSKTEQQTSGYTTVKSIITDSNGNIYSTGSFSGTIDFDPSANSFPLICSNGTGVFSNGFILKLDKNKNFLWVKQIKSDWVDGGRSIILDKNENIIVTGLASGPQIDLNPSEIDKYEVYNPNPGNRHGSYIIKLDPNGNFIFGNFYTEVHATESTLDNNNNIITTGSFGNANIDFDAGNGRYTLSANNFSDIFILKNNSNGEFIWAKNIGGNRSDSPTGIVCDNLNNIILAGNFESQISFLNKNYTSNNNSNFICKMKSDGQNLWFIQLGDLGGSGGDKSIKIDSSNNIYFVTSFNSYYKPFSPNFSNINLSLTSITTDSILFKINENGDYIWHNIIYGKEWQNLSSLALDKNENIHVIANVNTEAFINENCNKIFPNKNIYNSQEHILLKFNKSGDFINFKNIASRGNSLNIDFEDNILIGGASTGLPDFDPSPTNTFYINSTLYSDGYILKLKNCTSSIPEGDSYQTFCPNNSPTIANLQPCSSNINWYESSTANSPLSKNLPLIDGKIYYAAYLESCDNSSRLSVTAHISQSPQNPTLTLPVFCKSENKKLSDIITNGANVKWYNSLTNSTQLSKTTVLENGFTYYASQTENGCESERIPITAIINESAIPATTSPQTFCILQNSTISDITISGQNIKWYDAQTNGNQLPNTTAIQNGRTYYASQTINGCESERVPILINIQNTLPPTADPNQPFCTGSNPTIADIQVTGQNIKWYDALSNGSFLTETTNLVNGKTYYASQTVNNCESERFGITVSIVNTPSAPTTHATESFCKNENATLNDIQITGQNIKWYNTNFAAAVLPNNTLLENNKTYYGSQTIGCESDRTPILIRVYDTPLPAGNNNQQFCIDENATIANLSISGSNIKWYEDSTNRTVVAVTTFLENGETYYATQTLNNCESERLAITVKIQDTPIPIVNSPQVFCIQKNAKISDITIAGQNINWFESASSTINLPESTLLENGITYYASQTIDNCEGDRIPVSITILGATTSECINYVDELPFPKFFTPNNDGYNDTWVIDFAYLKSNTGIQIYDRYGKLLKVLLPNASWNGQFNNQELPATDYWFIVTRANGQEYKGHFSLKR